MSKNNRTEVVTEVWVLEEVFPYEGAEILGIYTTATLAKQTHGKVQAVKKWFEGGSDEPDFASTRNVMGAQPFFIVNKYPVYAGKQ